MIAFTSMLPKCIPMHLWTLPPKGTQAYLWLWSSARSGVKRSGSNVSGSRHHGYMRWVWNMPSMIVVPAGM